MNKEFFIIELNKLGLPVTEEQLTKLDTYMNILLEYNEHTNLTAIKNKEDIYLKHFYDSLTVSKYLNSACQILDIGTGAGFPGMVLAIFFPNIKFTLLDSNNKKIKFLQYLNTFLKLSNVEFINERAEIFAHSNQEKYDLVITRAVADLKILLEISLPILKINGKFIAMKSNVTEELKDIDIYLTELKGKIINQEEFFLPIENSKRTIIEIEHIAKTNSIYPRSYDKILKKPLKKNI